MIQINQIKYNQNEHEGSLRLHELSPERQRSLVTSIGFIARNVLNINNNSIIDVTIDRRGLAITDQEGRTRRITWNTDRGTWDGEDDRNNHYQYAGDPQNRVITQAFNDSLQPLTDHFVEVGLNSSEAEDFETTERIRRLSQRIERLSDSIETISRTIESLGRRRREPEFPMRPISPPLMHFPSPRRPEVDNSWVPGVLRHVSDLDEQIRRSQQ